MQHATSYQFDSELFESRAAEQADQMPQTELFNWVDDFDAVLALMPAEAVEAYYAAHRQLVTAAIISEGYAS